MKSGYEIRSPRTVGCLCMIGVALCTLAASSQGQPVLNFKRVINNWPNIELYFTVACNGQPAYFGDDKYFRIRENGVEIPDFELWCPDIQTRCVVSTALVFDASASMAGAPRAAAISAGRFIVDLFDGVNDEATVIWGTAAPRQEQRMTVYTDLLQSAIARVPAGGTSSIWDAVYEGLNALIADGVSPCRNLLVFTDGFDNSSIHSQNEVIQLANRNRIRIFTIGVGRDNDAPSLEYVATMTGGRYYEHPSTSQLTAIYQEMSVIIISGPQECLIVYYGSCSDGTSRTVDLSLVNFCGGSDTKTKTYKAPNFIGQFELAATPARLSSPGLVQLRPGGRFGYFMDEPTDSISFRCLFDTSLVTIDSVLLPSKSPLSGMQLSWTHDSFGIVGSLSGHGTLRYLSEVPHITFTYAPRVIPGDTMRSPFTCIFQSVKPCALLDTLSTTLVLLPPSAHLTATLSLPDSLKWDAALRVYQPDTLTASLRVENIGEVPAKPIRQWVACNDKVVGLVGSGPSNDTTSIAPGAVRTYTWQLRTTHARGVDTTGICAGVRASNTGVAEDCAVLKLTRLGLTAELGPIITSKGRSRIGVRAVCHGDSLRTLPTSSVFLTIDGQPVPIDSISAPSTTGEPALLFLHSPAPCPDGEWHTFSVTLAGMCDTTATAMRKAVAEFLRMPVTVMGPSRLCPGDSTVLDAGSGFVSYTWSTGDTTQRITVHRGGEFTVRVQTRPGCIQSGTAYISYVHRPVIWPEDTLLLCSGHHATLYSGIEEGDILWSNGATTPDIIVDTPGPYTVTAIGPNGCRITSDTVFVRVVPSLQPVLTAKGPVALCRGGSVLLETQAGFTGYRWSTGDSRTHSLIVTTSGEYSVTVYDASDSCSTTSNSIVVTVFDPPAKPVITRSGDVLQIPGGYEVQWYFGSTVIQGAVDTAYTATRTGSYKVRITNARGCSAESEYFHVGTLNIDVQHIEKTGLTFDIHPNPARDEVRMSIHSAGTFVLVRIVDVLGRVTRELYVDTRDGVAFVRFDVRGLPSGMYTIEVTNGTRSAARVLHVHR